jgi:GNAT superfamily N-acetyltransferase
VQRRTVDPARLASVADADVVAGLLDEGSMVSLLTGDPAVAVALVTLRPSRWYDGPVAVLDELYVLPDLRGRGLGSELLAATEAELRRRGTGLVEVNVDDDGSGTRRFYERHGYANTEPGEDDPLLHYYRELGD